VYLSKRSISWRLPQIQGIVHQCAFDTAGRPTHSVVSRRACKQ